MKNKTIFILVALAVFGISAVFGYYGPRWYHEHRMARDFADFVPPAVPKKQLEAFGATLHNLSATTEPKYLPDLPLKDLKGKAVRIEDFKGKPLLVNFWATWCLPCVVELPSLDKFAKAYEGRVQVIGIVAEQNKTAADIAGFLEKRQLGDFAGHLDPNGEFVKNLGIQGLPTSFLLGSNGQILYRFEGDADWTSAQAQDFFDVFLLQNR